MESRPQGKEIFEIVIEDVKPGCWKNYVAHQGIMMLMYIAIADSYIYKCQFRISYQRLLSHLMNILGEIRSLLRNSGVSAEFVNTWKFVSGDVTSKSIRLIKYTEVRINNFICVMSHE